MLSVCFLRTFFTFLLLLKASAFSPSFLLETNVILLMGDGVVFAARSKIANTSPSVCMWCYDHLMRSIVPEIQSEFSFDQKFVQIQFRINMWALFSCSYIQKIIIYFKLIVTDGTLVYTGKMTLCKLCIEVHVNVCYLMTPNDIQWRVMLSWRDMCYPGNCL